MRQNIIVIRAHLKAKVLQFIDILILFEFAQSIHLIRQTFYADIISRLTSVDKRFTCYGFVVTEHTMKEYTGTQCQQNAIN
jgi:hypothetical protein